MGETKIIRNVKRAVLLVPLKGRAVFFFSIDHVSSDLGSTRQSARGNTFMVIKTTDCNSPLTSNATLCVDYAL